MIEWITEKSEAVLQIFSLDLLQFVDRLRFDDTVSQCDDSESLFGVAFEDVVELIGDGIRQR